MTNRFSMYLFGKPFLGRCEECHGYDRLTVCIVNGTRVDLCSYCITIHEMNQAARQEVSGE